MKKFVKRDIFCQAVAISGKSFPENNALRLTLGQNFAIIISTSSLREGEEKKWGLRSSPSLSIGTNRGLARGFGLE